MDLHGQEFAVNSDGWSDTTMSLSSSCTVHLADVNPLLCPDTLPRRHSCPSQTVVINKQPPLANKTSKGLRSAEKRRRQEIKTCIDQMGGLLSASAVRKRTAGHLSIFAANLKKTRPSKVQILEAGIQHILHLEQTMAHLVDENQRLRRQLCINNQD